MFLYVKRYTYYIKTNGKGYKEGLTYTLILSKLDFDSTRQQIL